MLLRAKCKAVLVKEFGLSDQDIALCLRQHRSNLAQSKLISVAHFLSYIEHIQESAFTFKFIGLISIAEALFPEPIQKWQKLSRFMQGYLTEDEQRELLVGFCFSKNYRFRKAKIFPLRHIMFKDFVKDKRFRSRYFIRSIKEDVKHCSLSLCYCKQWLEQHPRKLSTYVERLAHNLYDVRNAILHDSSPALIITDGDSLLDAHSLLKSASHFRSYKSSGITQVRFISIVKLGISRYLTS